VVKIASAIGTGPRGNNPCRGILVVLPHQAPGGNILDGRVRLGARRLSEDELERREGVRQAWAKTAE
jgi:hypothetical protein